LVHRDDNNYLSNLASSLDRVTWVVFVYNNARCFAVGFSKPSCDGNCTTVWIANRDQPVDGKQSSLS